MSCTVLTCSKQNLRSRNKKDLVKSTGVVPAKYPLKVKLERISTTLEYQSWENYVYLDLWGFWSFYSNVEPTLISWWREYFLVGKIFINIHNLRDYFLTGIPIIMVGRGVHDISIPKSLETTHATWVPCRCHKGDTWLQQTISLLSVHLKLPVHLLISPSMSWIRLPTLLYQLYRILWLPCL